MVHRIALPLAIILLFAGLVLPAAAQDAGEGQGNYIIAEVRYHIEGKTREWALDQRLEIERGMSFHSEAELQLFIADRQQVLRNQRVLQEEGHIEYEIVPASAGRYNVFLDVFAEDTWNVIALPYFKLDSNSGLLLSARFRNYNFFGTMEQLRVNLNWENDSGEQAYSLDSSFSLPFRALSHDWAWSFGQDFEYTEGGDIEAAFDSTIGVDFPIGSQDWTLAFTQGYTWLDVHDDPDDYFLSSKVSFGTSYRLSAGLPGFGRLSYNPQVFTYADYLLEGRLPEDPDRQGVKVGFSHGLSAGRVDWIDNLRNGLEFSLGNTIEYNLYKAGWDGNVTSSVTGFKAFTDWFGVSSRVSGFYDFFDIEDEDAGAPIRGILDDHVQGNAGVYLNTDITFRLFNMSPLAHVQIGPFFDAAIIGTAKEDDLDIGLGDNFHYTAGFEVVVFPLFARSLYVRASLGVNVKAIREEGGSFRESENREIFIGLGHHY